MVSLAGLIEKHYVFENNPEAARFALLTRAAQLGHSGAQLFLERERFKFQQLQQQREFQQQQQQLMLQMFGRVLSRHADRHGKIFLKIFRPGLVACAS
jgi:hypothetical protein